MTVVAITFAIIFGLATGIFALYAHRANNSTVPYGVLSPLIGRSLRTSQADWESGHRRAVPYLWTAALIALVQTIACAVVVLYPPLLSPGYLIVIIVAGVALLLLLMFLGGRP